MSRRGTRLTEGRMDFTFDGRVIEARAGDCAASALLAQGIRLMGRSVKYRRPRGVFTAGLEEPNALFTVGAPPRVIPNVPATQLLIRSGLQMRSQNRWPTLRHDVHALLQLGSGMFGAGFYYKTFMWPSWRAYEGMIRRLAGLGEAPGECDLPRADIEHLHTDVLIAGAGPAGLAAGLAAARAGARVVICEREVACGGELDFEDGIIDGVDTASWIRETLTELHTRGVRVLTETAIIGGSGGLVIAHHQRGGLPGADTVYRIRPRTLIVAMGAVERPIAFVDNDVPGVMTLSAAERYLARYGVRVGASAVLFGNHNRLYAAARRLLAAGMRVRMIVDTRDANQAASAQPMRDELSREGVECLMSHAVLAAKGKFAVTGVTVAPIASPDSVRQIACDSVLVSGGWSPALHAGLHEGGVRELDAQLCAFVASGQPEWRALCGAAAGHMTLDAVIHDGWRAGVLAAQRAGATSEPDTSLSARADSEPQLVPFWRSAARSADEKKQFVDLQNDVTVADLRQSLVEGFRDIEHIKRYTTLGIGTEQGRTANAIGAAIVAELSGQTLGNVGTSRTRPPYQPVTLMALCGLRTGRALRSERRTPLHGLHESGGAVLEPAGLWSRPRFYTANGSDAYEAGIKEAARVRKHGGIFDGSTLGKIEVAGPDAAAFLDQLYLTRASTLKVGRGKYMVNLREDGMVLDDGIVLRLAPDRFLATVSTGHGAHMLSHFEFHRDVHLAQHAVALTDVTEAWAVIVVAGPQSRDTLKNVLGAEWHSPVAELPHMAFATGSWRDEDLRVLRASFSGELAFELHCRPAIAGALWEALSAAGLQPYGLEAVDILRTEKGYLGASEINGQTTPSDLGMQSMVAAGNACVGRELLERPAFHEPHRARLVGVRAADGKAKFLAGAHLTRDGSSTSSVGHITSAVFSPALQQWIGLALVARDQANDGTELLARDPLRGLETRVTVAPPVHFDPESSRMKA